MEPEPGEYGEWVSAVWGGRGYPGESLIGTRVCGSYAAHAWAVAALSSLACLARRRFGFSGSLWSSYENWVTFELLVASEFHFRFRKEHEPTVSDRRSNAGVLDQGAGIGSII